MVIMITGCYTLGPKGWSKTRGVRVVKVRVRVEVGVGVQVEDGIEVVIIRGTKVEAKEAVVKVLPVARVIVVAMVRGMFAMSLTV